MEIRVECYAGYRSEEEPRAFWLGERRLSVMELVDRWLEPASRCFKVKASDGDLYILRYDAARDVWELGAYTRAQAAGPSGLAPARGGAPRKYLH